MHDLHIIKINDQMFGSKNLLMNVTKTNEHSNVAIRTLIHCKTVVFSGHYLILIRDQPIMPA